MALPVCVARMVQVPVPISVTKLPLTPAVRQVAGVCVAKLATNPEDAVAATVKMLPIIRFGKGAKAIVCTPSRTEKLRCAWGAGL